jgi:predicted PhzF superfamily epimerase YddE/YHI9
MHLQISGNPAAICILELWSEDGLFQSIAKESNLAETAFITEKSLKAVTC